MAEHLSEIEYLNYHKQFAVGHKKLLHQSDGRNSFVGFQDEEWYLNQNRTGGSALGNFIMSMEPPSGKLAGDADMIVDEIMAGFAILGAIRDVDAKNFARIHEVSSECKVIGFQILMRMKRMSNGLIANSCSQFGAVFNLNQVTYEPVSHISVGYHGYLFRYPLRSKEPISYDDTVWL